MSTRRKWYRILNSDGAIQAVTQLLPGDNVIDGPLHFSQLGPLRRFIEISASDEPECQFQIIRYPSPHNSRKELGDAGYVRSTLWNDWGCEVWSVRIVWQTKS